MRRFTPSSTRMALRSPPRPTPRPCIRSSWRHVVQRTYSSEGSHGSHSSGSDLPWAIGSAAVFFPSAYYLIQQAPEKKPHAHGDEHDEGDHEESEQESKEDGDKEDTGEGETSAEESSAGSSGEPADDAPEESPSEDESSKAGDGSESDNSDQTPETTDDEESADSEEEQSDSDQVKPRKQKSTLDKRRESTSEVSKSQHPYMGEPGKSTKSEGVHETAKLSGTVDPFRKAR